MDERDFSKLQALLPSTPHLSWTFPTVLITINHCSYFQLFLAILPQRVLLKCTRADGRADPLMVDEDQWGP